jgi:hypothetical protein
MENDSEIDSNPTRYTATQDYKQEQHLLNRASIGAG